MAGDFRVRAVATEQGSSVLGTFQDWQDNSKHYADMA